ncbi:MAG: SDR family oxidoreductase [Eubacteriales bacterium]|nr:SDR family oxidoreductase [Eubacteriales bacterium]
MGIKSKIKKYLNKLRKVVKQPVYIPVLQGDLLKNKTVLITGGSGGIGSAIALSCIQNGASVIVAGRNKKKLKSTVDQLKSELKFDTQKVIPFVFDMQNVIGAKAKLYSLVEEYNIERIDVLVNNAGVSAGSSVGDTSEADFDKTLDTNLKGTYFLSQIVSNYMIENHIEGNILNVSSVSGIRPAITPYMVSKWGVIGLTQGLAKKLIKHGIVVNGIAPGPATTEMLGLDGSDLSYDKAPAGRYSAPVEIANLAIFLISDMGRMIVGDTVYITGGCGNLTVDDINY